MLIITHDLQLATGLCDSLAVMYSGEMIEFGKMFWPIRSIPIPGDYYSRCR